MGLLHGRDRRRLARTPPMGCAFRRMLPAVQGAVTLDLIDLLPAIGKVRRGWGGGGGLFEAEGKGHRSSSARPAIAVKFCRDSP